MSSRVLSQDGLDKGRVGVKHGGRQQLWLDKDEEATVGAGGLGCIRVR